MNSAVMFSSENEKWETPESVVSSLSPVFGFTLDVCASRPNVCANYYDEDADGLSREWGDMNWMNPPYGRDIGNWLRKAQQQAGKGRRTVALIPARTDTRWWHTYVVRAAIIVYIRGRLSFGSDEYWLGHWHRIAAEKLEKGTGSRDKILAQLAKNVSSPVRRDSAPFPSAFVVFKRPYINQLTDLQIATLASYGDFRQNYS